MQVENCIQKEKEGLMLPCPPMRRNSSDTCIPTCSSPAVFSPDRLSVKEATGCTLLCTSLPPSCNTTTIHKSVPLALSPMYNRKLTKNCRFPPKECPHNYYLWIGTKKEKDTRVALSIRLASFCRGSKANPTFPQPLASQNNTQCHLFSP
jgi:hypothetical protein